MKVQDKWPALYVGLNQIPTRDLKRLLRELEDRESELYFDGTIRDGDGR